MTELAVELSRRAEPSYVKAQAREFAVAKKEELTSHAKETAMRKTTEWKDQATHSPRGLGVLGAILGGSVGSFLMKRAFLKRDRYYGRSMETSLYPARAYEADYASTDVGYGVDTSSTDIYSGASMGDAYATSSTGSFGSESKVSQAKSAVSDKLHGVSDRLHGVSDSVQESLHNVKERASAKVGQARESAHGLRERVPPAGQVKRQATDWYSRSVQEQPLIFALGALAVGLIASALVPVSSKERQLIEPAKRKAEGTIQNLGGQLEQKLSGASSESQESESFDDSDELSESERISGPSLPLPPLDEFPQHH